MEATLGLVKPELLQVADNVAREKGIDREEVLEAMEQAIQKAGRSKYGHEYDIRADINRTTGQSLGQITLSIGASRYRPGEDAEALIKRADEALYAAKRRGRNRVLSEKDVSASAAA